MLRDAPADVSSQGGLNRLFFRRAWSPQGPLGEVVISGEEAPSRDGSAPATSALATQVGLTRDIVERLEESAELLAGAMSAELAAEHDRLAARVVQLVTALEESRTELAAARTAQAAAEERADRSESTSTGARAELANLAHEVADARSRLHREHAASAELRERLATAHDQLAEARTELGQAQTAARTAAQARATAERACAQADRQALEAHSYADDIIGERDAALARIHQSNAQLEAAIARITDLQEQLAKRDQQVTDLRATITTLTGERDAARAQTQQLQHKLDQLTPYVQQAPKGARHARHAGATAVSEFPEATPHTGRPTGTPPYGDPEIATRLP